MGAHHVPALRLQSGSYCTLIMKRPRSGPASYPHMDWGNVDFTDVPHDLEGVVPGMILQAPIFFARSLGCSLSFLWHGMLRSYTILLPTWVMATSFQGRRVRGAKKNNTVIATVVHMAELFYEPASLMDLRRASLWLTPPAVIE